MKAKHHKSHITYLLGARNGVGRCKTWHSFPEYQLVRSYPSPTQPPSRRRRIFTRQVCPVNPSRHGGGAKTTRWGIGTSCSAVITSGLAEERLQGVNGVSTSLSQLDSITRLCLRSVSRHRGQLLFLQVRGGCQITTTVSLQHLKEAALPTD
jgi:hypothetical protein